MKTITILLVALLFRFNGIAQTTNTLLYDNIRFTINDFHVFSDTSFVLIGDQGKIAWTNTDFAEFAQVNLPSTSNLYCLDFFNRSTGVVAGEFGTVFRTQDSAKTWQLVPLATGVALNDLEAFPNGRGILVGQNGKLFKSNDFGASWHQDTLAITSTFKDLQMFSADSGFALLANGQVLRTTDGFNHFDTLVSMPSIGRMSFSNFRFGFFSAKADGKAYRTLDGGLNIEGPPTFHPAFQGVVINLGKKMLANFGSNQYGWVSNDSGRTFTSVYNIWGEVGTSTYIVGVSARALGQNVYVAGQSGFVGVLQAASLPVLSGVKNFGGLSWRTRMRKLDSNTVIFNTSYKILKTHIPSRKISTLKDFREENPSNIGDFYQAPGELVVTFNNGKKVYHQSANPKWFNLESRYANDIFEYQGGFAFNYSQCQSPSNFYVSTFDNAENALRCSLNIPLYLGYGGVIAQTDSILVHHYSSGRRMVSLNFGRTWEIRDLTGLPTLKTMQMGDTSFALVSDGTSRIYRTVDGFGSYDLNYDIGANEAVYGIAKINDSTFAATASNGALHLTYDRGNTWKKWYTNLTFSPTGYQSFRALNLLNDSTVVTTNTAGALYLIELHQPILVSRSEDQNLEEVRIYPNPIGEGWLRMKGEGIESIELTDSHGRHWKTEIRNGEGGFELNTRGLSPGLYQLVFTQNGIRKWKRFSKV